MPNNKRVICRICNKELKTLYTHLCVHKITKEEYIVMFPDSPLSIDKSLLGMKAPANVPWNKGTKGGIAWNKGLTKETDIRVAAYAENVKKTVKKLYDNGFVNWNSGLTKHDHPSLMKLSKDRMGDKNPVHTPGTKERISKTIKQTYKDNPEILQNRKRCGINQYSNCFTSIERIIADVLDYYEIEYIHNARVLSYFPDFLIFNNIIIECDGEYWHDLNSEKEQVRDRRLLKNGYKVYHLTESEIMEDPFFCVNNIIKNY